ncbi:MAG: DUF4339 domain-containing protein [Bdellovibrionia bacterium]
MSGNAATTQITFPKEGFYLYYEGQNLGPFTMEQVLQKFDGGAVQRTTPLWFPGLANWITIADLPNLDRRGPIAKEIELPEKDRPDAIIIQLKTHALPLRPQSVKALVTNEDLRRTDMVYDESTKNWIRADQHPIVRAYFSMPAGPTPLPAASLTAPAAAAPAATATAEVKPAPAVATAPLAVAAPAAAPAALAATAASATVQAKAKSPAAEKPSEKSKLKFVWLAISILAIAICAFLLWKLLPQFRKAASTFKSPATVQPASFMAFPVEEFGVSERPQQNETPAKK